MGWAHDGIGQRTVELFEMLEALAHLADVRRRALRVSDTACARV